MEQICNLLLDKTCSETQPNEGEEREEKRRDLPWLEGYRLLEEQKIWKIGIWWGWSDEDVFTWMSKSWQ